MDSVFGSLVASLTWGFEALASDWRKVCKSVMMDYCARHAFRETKEKEQAISKIEMESARDTQ
jgi:hypothetical protein